MLILTRKLGEQITIGDDITITLLEIKGNQAKLGVKAPKSVVIYRQEIYEKIREANLESCDVSAADLSDAASIFENIKPKRDGNIEDQNHKVRNH